MEALRKVPEAGIASVLVHLPSDQIARTLSLLSSRRAAAVEVALSKMRRAAAATMEDLPAGATAPVETTAWQAGANISAKTAYRLVRSYVQRKIGQFLWADESSLRTGPPPIWAVPVILIDPGVGRIGQVGQLHVDAATGELMIEEGDVERIQRNARALSNAAAL
jgi:hypothetical protein